MAEHNVPDEASRFDLDTARDALREMGRARAILWAVGLAVAAQEDGSVEYDDNELSGWGPAVDAASAHLHAVRYAFCNTVDNPSTVDWWTSLNLVEAMGAALWHVGTGSHKGKVSGDQVRACADAAIESLDQMREEMIAVIRTLEANTTEQGSNG